MVTVCVTELNSDDSLRRRWAARKAVEAGAAGVIVSNHGARQLDYAPATISVLEEVIGRRPAGHIYPPGSWPTPHMQAQRMGWTRTRSLHHCMCGTVGVLLLRRAAVAAIN